MVEETVLARGERVDEDLRATKPAMTPRAQPLQPQAQPLDPTLQPRPPLPNTANECVAAEPLQANAAPTSASATASAAANAAPLAAGPQTHPLQPQAQTLSAAIEAGRPAVVGGMRVADAGGEASPPAEGGLLDSRSQLAESQPAGQPRSEQLEPGVVEGQNGAAGAPHHMGTAAGSDTTPHRGPVLPGQLPRNTCCGTPLQAPDFVGPVLKLVGCIPNTNLWVASVLVVCRSDMYPHMQLHLEDNGVRVTPLQPLWLGDYQGWGFLRWKIQLEMQDQERAVTYWLSSHGSHSHHHHHHHHHQRPAEAVGPDTAWDPRGLSPSGPIAAAVGAAAGLVDHMAGSHSHTPRLNTPFQFYVPGVDQTWHWGFYSCSGFSNDVPEADKTEKYGGVDTLWKDVMAQHAKRPFHCLLGVGDQLYNDDLFQLPSMQAWLNGTDFQEKRHTQPTQDMMQELLAYYFHHYCVHFSFGAIQEAYATIPQIMTWDDHDIFDGWGSYPTGLQKCSVFQTIFEAARRFYLLFQLQTNAELARQDGYFGLDSYSTVLLLGSRLALALPDQRSERTHHIIMPMETHFMLMAQLQSLPSSVKHLVFVATVPMVYPHLTGSHTVLKACRGATRLPLLGWLLAKSGLKHVLLSKHSEPELLDDLRDHWVAPSHLEERRFMLEHLQMVARTKGVRMTLISGDVHLCAVGCAHTPHRPAMMGPHKLYDYRYMPQVVSSAIINAPPPDVLVRALRLVSRPKYVNRHTRVKMVRVFMDHKKRTRMLNRRNWCEVWEQGVEESNAAVAPHRHYHRGHHKEPQGTLVFSLRVEDTNKPPKGGLQPGNLKEYRFLVPPLFLKVPRRGQEGFYDRRF